MDTKKEFSPPPPRVIPEKIGEYKVDSFFSEGGMGVLYLGTHPKTGEKVVIKVVQQKYLKDREMLSRLIREARVLSITNHPNIVKLYDVGQWEEGIYVAMEYVEGISLRQFIRERALTARKAIEIVLQIAYGLSHLHAHGIIHRDLKPENVLITESGNIKLIDFGIALFLDRAAQGEMLTTYAARLGTPFYMSPEQKENPEKISFSADVYSLGLITYELFLGTTSQGLVHLSLLPPRLAKIIEKSIQFDPNKRYKEIEQFIAEINDFLKRIDEKEAKTSDVLYEMLRESRSFLISHKPSMPFVEIGLAAREGLSYHTPYLDFFSFSQNKLGIFAAEPQDIGIHSLASASMLKGIIRSMIFQTQDPREILLRTKQILFKEKISHLFNAAFILLDDEKGTVNYISCNYGSFWEYPSPETPKRVFTPQNSPLGPDLEPLNILEEPWNRESTFIFSTLDIPPILSFRQDLLLAPQPLSEKALDLVYPRNLAGILLAIKRL
ncbi:MAG: serine/threonine protein kinase [Parachlamydiales bacterium]|nr:serine/threonine protein kinase [Parachlamydiales bacterium]